MPYSLYDYNRVTLNCGSYTDSIFGTGRSIRRTTGRDLSTKHRFFLVRELAAVGLDRAAAFPLGHEHNARSTRFNQFRFLWERCCKGH